MRITESADIFVSQSRLPAIRQSVTPERDRHLIDRPFPRRQPRKGSNPLPDPAAATAPGSHAEGTLCKCREYASRHAIGMGSVRSDRADTSRRRHRDTSGHARQNHPISAAPPPARFSAALSQGALEAAEVTTFALSPPRFSSRLDLPLRRRETSGRAPCRLRSAPSAALDGTGRLSPNIAAAERISPSMSKASARRSPCPATTARPSRRLRRATAKPMAGAITLTTAILLGASSGIAAAAPQPGVTGAGPSQQDHHDTQPGVSTPQQPGTTTPAAPHRLNCRPHARPSRVHWARYFPIPRNAARRNTGPRRRNRVPKTASPTRTRERTPHPRPHWGKTCRICTHRNRSRTLRR